MGSSAGIVNSARTRSVFLQHVLCMTWGWLYWLPIVSLPPRPFEHIQHPIYYPNCSNGGVKAASFIQRDHFLLFILFRTIRSYRRPFSTFLSDCSYSRDIAWCWTSGLVRSPQSLRGVSSERTDSFQLIIWRLQFRVRWPCFPVSVEAGYNGCAGIIMWWGRKQKERTRQTMHASKSVLFQEPPSRGTLLHPWPGDFQQTPQTPSQMESPPLKSISH